MDSARLARIARRKAGLTLRALAERAGTSHATLAAYESGRKVPRVDTLDRILRAAGFAAEVDLSPGGQRVDREAKGRELEQVLRLAGEFPARHDRELRFPVFGRT